MSAASWRPTELARRPAHDPPRILVAEDDPEMLDILVQVLAADGYEVAHCAVPMILMTGFADPHARTRAQSLGAVLFNKPFGLDDRSTVVELLARAHPPTNRP